MAKAYTPGLKVTSNTRLRVRRVLPIPGDVLVKQGQRVNARDVVAQTFMPGDITPVNLANLLSLPPNEVSECMLKKVGEKIKVGEPMARTKGIFGMLKNTYTSKHEGTIEAVSDVTGQVMLRGEPLPVQVLAYLSGTVTQVIPNEGVYIEADVTFVQGIFGIGGEVFGPIKMACASHEEDLHEDLITPQMKGAIVVGGARMTAEAIRKAVKLGVAALVSGGIDDQDLKDFLGYDLGVAITGSEKMGITLIITEGFGDITMAKRSFLLLAGQEGNEASVSGATQIRAGVMRPEVVIPLKQQEGAPGGAAAGSRISSGELQIGTPVRIIRDPHFGVIGSVSELPPEPRVLGSGSKARVLVVKCESGESVVIPRANVELIEG